MVILEACGHCRSSASSKRMINSIPFVQQDWGTLAGHFPPRAGTLFCNETAPKQEGSRAPLTQDTLPAGCIESWSRLCGVCLRVIRRKSEELKSTESLTSYSEMNLTRLATRQEAFTDCLHRERLRMYVPLLFAQLCISLLSHLGKVPRFTRNEDYLAGCNVVLAAPLLVGF